MPNIWDGGNFILKLLFEHRHRQTHRTDQVLYLDHYSGR